MLALRETNTMAHRQEILFVDDVKGVREGWRRLLSTDERMVTTAADGDSAICGLQSHPVDLVISDLRMPGADGLELLEWLHDNEPDTPFVLITGYGSPEVEAKARKLGAYGYLEKPVSPDDLEEMALAALRGDQSSWAHAVVADDPAEVSETAEGTATIHQLVRKTEETAQVVETAEAKPGSFRQLVRLMVSPFMGLAYIMFLPVIGIAAAIYGIGMLVAKPFRPAVVTGIEPPAVVCEEKKAEPAVKATTFDPGSLRELGRLAVSPFIGLAFIMFLPVIGIAAAIYGTGMLFAKALRPAVVTGIETPAVVAEEERMAPVVDSMTFDPGSLRDFGRLVAAPFKGLAYIVCLPLIIFSAVAYGVSEKIIRVFRLANVR